MTAQSIDVKLNLAAQEAAQKLAQIDTALGDVETAVEQVESAGKIMAKALSASADVIEADLVAASTSADKLGNALGPELAAKLGRSGVEDLVADLKKLGLTTEEIDADVDALAVSIQHLDQVGQSLTGPQKGIRDIGDEADRAKGQIGGMSDKADNSRSVMANMAGNSAQDLANIGGAAGTTGLALGQMAEYAADGNIKLSGLAKVVGPMAALTVATLALSQGSKQAAERAKELTEDYKKLTTATDAQALAVLGDMFLSVALDGKNLTDMFLEMADANIVGAKRLLDLQIQAGYTTEQTKLLRDAIAEEERQTIQGAETNAKYGDGLTKVADGYRETSPAIAETERETRRLEGAMGDLTSAEVEAANKALAYEMQVDKTNTAVQQDIAAMQAKWDELSGNIDREQAWIGIQQQVADVRTAIEEAGKVTKEKGPGSPEALAANQEAQMKTLALKEEVINYGREILGLPPEKVTELLAQIDQANFDATLSEMDRQLLTRTFRINAHLDTIVVDGETHAAGRTGNITVDSTVGRQRNAHGGPADGWGSRDEMGRELAYFAPGSFVLAASQTANLEQQPSYVDNSTHHYHIPPGLNPEQTAKALRTYHRRGGR